MPGEARGRASILDTAAKLFSQKGYRGVSIRDIAQACGMTNAALYYHFENKEDLYLAVLRRSHEKIMASIAARGNGDRDLRARLKRLVLAYADVMCEQRQSFHSMRRDLASVDSARAGKLFGEMRSTFMRPIVDVIESGQADGTIARGDARVYARLLHGMIIALTFEGPGRHQRLTPAEADVLVDVFLDGAGRKP